MKSPRLVSVAGSVSLIMLLACTLPGSAVAADLMPAPAAMSAQDGRFALTNALQVTLAGPADPRVNSAVGVTLRAWERRTGLTFARDRDGKWATSARASVRIEFSQVSASVPKPVEDEAYELAVNPEGVVLRATSSFGVLRGLATLTQLPQSDAAGWFLPCLQVADSPRFPWRGLMIDVCRHWQPMEVIKRNLDGMALVKLNVLHLHLTEDQGFRIESKTCPQLHERGSDGHYFTQDEMREIIAYAAARGIRVVPEFDIPGHATSWVTALPELASAPGPYVIERRWGVFDPVLDPTNEAVYDLLGKFLGEMAALFPDEYIHIGGDENNGVQWNANPRIQAYIKEHGLKDNAGLHAMFNRRVHAILAGHGKKMIGWDEILHPDLPAGSVVHSWRGPEGVAAATQAGYATVLSNGYYIDLCHPAADHYLNDPAPLAAPLAAEQRKLVLGGEATMWNEWTDPVTIDSRIWPRTAAIAERLWSPATVRDVTDMYRRLALVSQRLEEAGLRHVSYIDPHLRQLAGDRATAQDLRDLRLFADCIEPVKNYQRGQHQPHATQFMPLTGLVDCARPDSAPAREFAAAVKRLAKAPGARTELAEVSAALESWRQCADRLLARWPELSPQLATARPVLESWQRASAEGLAAVAALQAGQPASTKPRAEVEAQVRDLLKPHDAVELPLGAPLAQLLSLHP